MASTLNGTGVTFSDGTTQNSGSAYLAIGTVAQLANFQRTSYPANSTSVPAANIGYISGGNGGTQGYLFGSAILRPGNTTVPGTGQSGYANTTAVTGTWRSLGGVQGGYFDSCNSYSGGYNCLFVRVS